MLIVLSGVIGAGKTSLSKELAKFLNTNAFLEPVKGNPVLPRFYKGNKLVQKGQWTTNPYTFLLQVYFLNLRFKMMKQAMQNDNDILDRSIYEDRLFMKMNYELGNTTKEEWDIYQALLSNMMEELPYAAYTKAPSLMIYLKISLNKQLQHIRLRGRSYEQVENDPSLKDYYKKLQTKYAKWYQDYNASPKMMINVDKYDFVHNEDDLKHVLKLIENKLIEIGKLSVKSVAGDIY